MSDGILESNKASPKVAGGTSAQEQQMKTGFACPTELLPCRQPMRKSFATPSTVRPSELDIGFLSPTDPKSGRRLGNRALIIRDTGKKDKISKRQNIPKYTYFQKFNDRIRHGQQIGRYHFLPTNQGSQGRGGQETGN
jgi:hypothetical protein